MPHRPLYLSRSLRQLEREAQSLAPTPSLMERAGLAGAQTAQRLLGDAGRVLVIAGPGNNGGDAFVSARHLRSWWYDVTLVFAGDENNLPDDARRAFAAWRDSGGDVLHAIPARKHWDLCLDGLFGIGLQRPLEGGWQELVASLNRLDMPMLSIDIPSGLCADTGRVLGCAVKAAHTLTFLGRKPGLHTLEGPDLCGEITVDSLGLDPSLFPAPDGWLVDRESAGACLKPRPGNSHKGSFGSAGILGGADGMVGAALLSARAALKLGAGRVYAGLCAEPAPACDWGQPELMLRKAGELLALKDLTALAVGPGLGVSESASMLLEKAIPLPIPLILDADALNLVSLKPPLAQALADRQAPSILTPHPAEAARLMACAVEAVQADRIAAATALAKRFGAYVVLKGSGSVCATPAGQWFVNPTGNPALASAGSGDVLTGMIAGLLAQGLSAENALLLGVNLHGAAADDLVAAGHGPIGLAAGELIEAARTGLNRLAYLPARTGR